MIIIDNLGRGKERLMHEAAAVHVSVGLVGLRVTSILLLSVHSYPLFLYMASRAIDKPLLLSAMLASKDEVAMI